MILLLFPSAPNLRPCYLQPFDKYIKPPLHSKILHRLMMCLKNAHGYVSLIVKSENDLSYFENRSLTLPLKAFLLHTYFDTLTLHICER